MHYIWMIYGGMIEERILIPKKKRKKKIGSIQSQWIEKKTRVIMQIAESYKKEKKINVKVKLRKTLSSCVCVCALKMKQVKSTL